MTVSLTHTGEGLDTAWRDRLARQLRAEAGRGMSDLARVVGDIPGDLRVRGPPVGRAAPPT
jgi:hypothetical protein